MAYKIAEATPLVFFKQTYYINIESKSQANAVNVQRNIETLKFLDIYIWRS